MYMDEKFTINECPTCGSEKIKKVRKNWSGEYKGQRYLVPSLEYYECPDCDEKIYDRYAMRRIQEKSPAIKKRHRSKAA